MSLAALTAALEIEIQRLRWQVAELPAGSLDHARLANTNATSPPRGLF